MFKNAIFSYRTVSLLTFLFILPLHADTLIAPNQAGINYYGRFDFTDSAKPRCNWSGSIIEASFPGPTIGMRMDFINALYDVEIDGVLDTVISTGSVKDFVFRKNLSTQNHTVRIMLRSEDHYGAGTFLGLYLANGKVLSAPPAKPVLKIEFIGDSYTAGYGIESPGRSCSSDILRKTTNANRAFPQLATSALHAQSIILGWSGAGMVRNYGEAAKRSTAPFPAHYDQRLGEAWNGGKWDFSTWKPDLVVICLGTNDYSTVPIPDDSMFTGDYHKFIARVLTNYPQASVLCVSTGDILLEKNVQKVVTEEIAAFNHPKVYFAAFPDTVELTGCDWHPSIKDNSKIAGVLVDTIMKKLLWDTAVSSVAFSPLRSENIYRTDVALSGRMMNNRFEIALAGKGVAVVSLMLLNMRGEVIDHRMADAENRCSFNMDRYSSGVYLAGNSRYGWVTAVVRR